MKFGTKFLSLATAATLALAGTPVNAQDFHHDHDHYHEGFHDGPHDFHYDHYFHGFHYDHWRGGRWFSGFHGGRNGWWWIVDGSWYFYPAPVYPFPDPYMPPGVVVETAPAGMQAYYYCPSPDGYYPVVAECAAPWQRSIQPVQVPVQTAMAPPQQPMSPPLAPPPGAPPMDQRSADLQSLNGYAAALQAMNPADPTALNQLKTLSKQVSALRHVVQKRDYNPLSMLKNIDDLKKRINEKRKTVLAMRSPPPVTYQAVPPVQPPVTYGPPPTYAPPPQ